MEPDTLATLEERIRSAVEVVSQLRKDKDAALQAAADAEQLKQRISVLTAELDTVRGERDTLKSERENVRRRVEKLLEQIDALGAA